MVRYALLGLVGILSMGSSAAQSDKGLPSPTQTLPANSLSSTSLPAGAAIRASVTSSIDSKKIKPGDIVTARTVNAVKVDGQTVIPSGSKLVGHVTHASARSKGDSFSSVGIVFDKALLKHGEEIPLSVSIQAIASPQQIATAASSAAEMDSGYMRAAGSASPSRPGTPSNMAPPAGSASGNVTNTVANTDTNNATSGKGAVGGLDSNGQLTVDSRGVFGLEGIGLAAGTIGAEHSTVITSTGKEVRLDSGTQLLLVTQSADAKQAAGN
jgi:hypothetical protein